jgi:hypothetical protein
MTQPPNARFGPHGEMVRGDGVVTMLAGGIALGGV